MTSSKRLEYVPVPEWGGTVLVRGLTRAERDRFTVEYIQDSRLAQVRLVILGTTDDRGEPLFKPDDLEALSGKAAAPLYRIAAAVRRLSGLGASSASPKGFLEEVLRPRADIEVATWERWYRETGNPLFAWKALRAARHGRVPIPDSVLDYLEEVADDISLLADAPPSPRDRADAIAKALRLQKERAGRGLFEKYGKHKRNLEIALAVLDSDRGKNYLAFEDVARQYGLSETRVRTIFLEYCGDSVN